MKVTVDKILGILREQDAVSGGGSSGGSVTIPDATQTTSGLMSAEDKAAVDGMQERGFYPQLAAVPSPVDFDQMTETG
uniref:hypothetical protein n=1 Tax=uncultured Victivallis sp. TaxID=354118 RepID=UPI0025D562A4